MAHKSFILFGTIGLFVSLGAPAALAGVDPEACCLTEGGCIDLPAEDCAGTPLGSGTSCAANADQCVAVPAASEWGLAILALTVLAAGTIIMRRTRRSGVATSIVGCALLIAAPSIAFAQANVKVIDREGDGLRKIIVNPHGPPRIRPDATPRLDRTRPVRIVHHDPIPTPEELAERDRVEAAAAVESHVEYPWLDAGDDPHPFRVRWSHEEGRVRGHVLHVHPALASGDDGHTPSLGRRRYSQAPRRARAPARDHDADL